MPKILIEHSNGVAVLTLNDPASYNAMGGRLLAELGDALDAAGADDQVRAVLLTGAGRGFCSGANLKTGTFSAGEGIGEEMRVGINPIIEKMRTLAKPVVVAVNGAAAGAGVGLALAGDIVIAARSARFILSFARLGAALDGGTSLFVQAAIGAARARALALLGEPLDAETAERWGLIWKAVDDGELMDEARAIAMRLAAGPPIALALIKGQVESAPGAAVGDILEAEARAQARAFGTQDLREGAAAFVEKRPPRFLGR